MALSRNLLSLFSPNRGIFFFNLPKLNLSKSLFYVGQKEIPEYINTAMKKQFELAKQVKMYSTNNGWAIEYDFCIKILDISITSTWFVKHALSNKKDVKTPIEILEIGTSWGNVLKQIKYLYKDKFNLTGITASDPYWRRPKEFNHVVGDAHQLLTTSSNIQENQFERIFSRYTFDHLINPLLVLTLAYRALKPNGILLIDFMPVNGLTPQECLELIIYLKQQGYQIAAAVKSYSIAYENPGNKKIPLLKPTPYGQLVSITIKKTHAELHLPIAYSNLDENKKVTYRLILPKDAKLTYLNHNFSEDITDIFYPGLMKKEKICKERLLSNSFGFFHYKELRKLMGVNKLMHQSLQPIIDEIDHVSSYP